MLKNNKLILNVSRRLLLYTNYTEKQISKMLYVSETSLRNIYIQNFGLPPKRYIRRVKIKKAQTLLRITSKTVSEIALDVGYTNASKFTEAFKEILGETPSEYRKVCGFGVAKTSR